MKSLAHDLSLYIYSDPSLTLKILPDFRSMAETTRDLIGNKIANKRTSQQNNSETVTNEHDKEIPREGYISPEQKQTIIDDLKLI